MGKSEIAYHGDVLNTTARILSKCHDLESELLVSDWVIEKIEMPKYLKSDAMGSFQLKGKQQEVELHSVYMSVKKRMKRNGQEIYSGEKCSHRKFIYTLGHFCFGKKKVYKNNIKKGEKFFFLKSKKKNQNPPFWENPENVGAG